MSNKRRFVLVIVLFTLGNLYAQGKGHIQVKCEPGVKVFLDDNFKGETTAELGGFIIQDVAVGRHALKLVKLKHAPQTTHLTLSEGQVLVYTARAFSPKIEIADEGKEAAGILELKTGTLIVQSLPVECTISLPSLGLNNIKKTRDRKIFKNVPTGTYKAIFKGIGEPIEHEVAVYTNVGTSLLVNFLETNVQVKYLAVTNSIGMKFVWIPPGEFKMGSPSTEKGRDDDEGPQHQVRISKGFFMGQTEVTQGQYKSVMNTQPWSGQEYVRQSDNTPASYISWNDAIEFYKKLSQREGRTYRLPTEAEWEYACRSGTKTAYSFGDSESSLGDYAWFNGNAIDVGQKYPHEVRQKRPNAFGLYGMHGNVSEWCSDRYDYDENYYARSPSVDPKGISNRTGLRVYRGGAWNSTLSASRSASRRWFRMGSQWPHVGFRVVLEGDSQVEASNATISAPTQPANAGRTGTGKITDQGNRSDASEDYKGDSVDSVDENIAKSSGPTVDETVQFIGEKLRDQDIEFNYRGEVYYEDEQGKDVAAWGPELILTLKDSNGYFEQAFWIALDGVDFDSVRTSGSYVVFECKNGLNRIMEQHWTGRDYNTGAYSDATKVNSARLRCFSSEDAEKVTKALRHLIDLVVVKEESLF